MGNVQPLKKPHTSSGKGAKRRYPRIPTRMVRADYGAKLLQHFIVPESRDQWIECRHCLKPVGSRRLKEHLLQRHPELVPGRTLTGRWA